MHFSGKGIYVSTVWRRDSLVFKHFFGRVLAFFTLNMVNVLEEHLFVIKSRRLLTYHISSITITAKKCAGYKDEQAYNANYKTTQNINIV